MSLKLGAEEAAANCFPLKKKNQIILLLSSKLQFYFACVQIAGGHRTVVETLQITFWVICLLGEILPPKPGLQGWALAIQTPLPGHSFAN